MTQKNDKTTEGTEENLSQQKLSLEVHELKVKLKSLQSPFYKKSGFWFSVITIIVAVVGVAGQGYVSVIKSNLAELKVENANKKLDEFQAQAKKVEDEKVIALQQRDTAIRDASKVERRMNELQNKIATLKNETQSFETRINNASLLLFKINALIPNTKQFAKESKSPEDLIALIAKLEQVMKKAQYELYGMRIEILNYQNKSKNKQLNIKLITSPSGLTFYLIPYSEWIILKKNHNLLPLLDEVKNRFKLHTTPAELSVPTGTYFITISYNDQIVDSIPVTLD